MAGDIGSLPPSESQGGTLGGGPFGGWQGGSQAVPPPEIAGLWGNNGNTDSGKGGKGGKGGWSEKGKGGGFVNTEDLAATATSIAEASIGEPAAVTPAPNSDVLDAIRKAQSQAASNRSMNIRAAQAEAASRRRPDGALDYMAHAREPAASGPFEAQHFLGAWVDSQGNSVNVFSTDAYAMSLLVCLSARSRQRTMPLRMDEAGFWKCGNSTLDAAHSSYRRLQWTLANGQPSVWVRGRE
mmetsp:Transcript_70615/g.132136  ORF Transcript_70615/g.132136 Transcript_70615/m.132136 type:complete len:240 (+) Transcript_70615:32-751(+)